MKCRKCDKELSVSLSYDNDAEVMIYNSLYGCDSGCEYVRFEVECPCGDSFETGEFGCFENDEEAAEHLEELKREYYG